MPPLESQTKIFEELFSTSYTSNFKGIISDKIDFTS